MSITELSLITQSLLFLTLLAAGLLYALPQQRTMILRQNLFALREELFDYAAAGNIEFNHPAYELLRNFLNGFIRYGHRVNVLDILITLHRWAAMKQLHPLSWHLKWTASIENLPTQTEKELQLFHFRASQIILTHLIKGSPILWIFVGYLFCHAFFRAAGSSASIVWQNIVGQFVKDHAEKFGAFAVRA